MRIDLSIGLIGAHAADIVATAREAEALGFHGIAVADELSDVSGEGQWSHEPMVLLSAIAMVTERVALGTLVLNIANRDPGTFAVQSATLQQLSDGRLWLGLGAGTGPDSPYSDDQRAFRRPPANAATRRKRLAEHIDEVRRIWADEAGDGFLTPDPLPPLIVGTFGPKTAQLAGRHADGIAAPITPFGDNPTQIEELATIAREAHAAAGRSGELEIVAHHGIDEPIDHPKWRAGSDVYDRLAEVGASRLILDAPASPELLREAARKLPLGS